MGVCSSPPLSIDFHEDEDELPDEDDEDLVEDDTEDDSDAEDSDSDSDSDRTTAALLLAVAGYPEGALLYLAATANDGDGHDDETVDSDSDVYDNELELVESDLETLSADNLTGRSNTMEQDVQVISDDSSDSDIEFSGVQVLDQGHSSESSLSLDQPVIARTPEQPVIARTPERPAPQPYIETPTGRHSTAHNPDGRSNSGATAEVASGSDSHPPQNTDPTPGPSSLDTSSAEFQAPKRPKLQSPSTAKPAVAMDAADDDEDGQCCPICFEPWTNSGVHRLASLKCGHLFGQSCIEKWLRGQGGKCPQCNLKAKRKDIRVIYAKALKVTDTTERDRAIQELNKEREARRAVEIQAAETRLFLQVARDECKQLTQDLHRQRQQMTSLKASSGCGLLPDSPSKVPPSQRARFSVDKTVKIWEAGGCRVMAYCPVVAALCVSQPSASPLFPGYGVKKVNVLDFRNSQYVALHSKMIRDVAFNEYSGDTLLLSASMDKSIKLTSLLSNAVVQMYNCPQPVWSCVWNSDDRNYFFAGLQNGSVHLYDTRNTQQHVKVLNEGGGSSPVVSLQYIKQNPNSDFRPGGIFVGQLNRSQFLERRAGDDFKLHILPLEGNVTSLSVDDTSRHLLATYRPSHRQPSVRHVLYQMASQNMTNTDNAAADALCTCNQVQTYHGGSTQKVLARTKLIGQAGGGGLVVAGDEASLCLHVWDTASGLLHQKIPIHAPVIDVVSYHSNQQLHLIALTDKQITVMKWE